MSKKDKDQELIKSLVSELGLSEEEVLEALYKSDDSEEDEDEDSAEDKKEDEKEEKKEESKKKEDMAEKSDKPDIFKSLRKDIKKLRETIEKSQDNELIKSLVATVNSLKEDLELVKSQSSDIFKSVDAIGSNSQGTKGMRFNNYLEKGGDKPFTKDGKTIIQSTDRDTISEIMLSTIEKSEDEDLVKSMGVDLINYQGSGQLSERAVKSLNKALVS